MMTDVLNIDIHATKTFLEALDPRGVFSFATFDDCGSDKMLVRRLHGHFEEHMDELVTLNHSTAGVFVTVNETDGAGFSKEHVNDIRAVFVDLDGASLEPVEVWALKPHIVVESSPGRWHAYWLLEGLSLDRFREVQQALAACFDGDARVCDLPRVMRLPGFNHHKGEPVMVTIKTIRSEQERYTADRMLMALGLSTTTTSTLTAVSSRIPAGKRNGKLAAIAGRLRRNGKSRDEIEGALLHINMAECDPPLEEAEVRKIAESISRYSSGGEMTTEIATSDTGNAQRFVEQHGSDLKFVPEMKKWLVWEDGHWKIDTSNRVIQCAKHTAKSLLSDAAEITSDSGRIALTKHAGQSLNRTRLNSMIALASSEPGVVVHMKELDKDDFMLGTQNGVVDLRSGEFRPARRDDLMTQRCGTPFDPAAKCPTFDAFLDRVTGGDVDLQSYLQRLAGYCLTGDTSEHCFAFLYGHGANGKSTFLDALMRLIGDYASQTQPETLMARRGGGANNDLARLVGKRLVVSNEVMEGAHLEENLIKQLSGGDVVTARFLFQEHFEFTPKFKILIAGNHQPVIKGDDDGIWRRIHLVPFVQTIPEKERDKHLGQKLAMELPGILNWAIAGCKEWQANGLSAPKVITDATARYREEMDLLGKWIDEECEVGPGLRYSSRLLYDNYRSWCERGCIKPLSSAMFARKLETRKFRKEHMRSGNFLLGIQLRSGGGSSMPIAA